MAPKLVSSSERPTLQSVAVVAPAAEPPAQIGPLVVPQVYEQVAELIRQKVSSGTLRPGERLPSERDLARMLGVSRPSVREAIASLNLDGVLNTRRGAGSFVASDAIDVLARHLAAEARDVSPVALLEVREYLEPAAARLAALRGGRDARTEELLESMEEVIDIEDRTQRQLWGETDRLFHLQIGLMANNVVLAEICRYVADIMGQPLWRKLRDESLYTDGRIATYRSEHRAIYESVASGDVEASVFHAGHHVRAVRQHIAVDPVRDS